MHAYHRSLRRFRLPHTLLAGFAIAALTLTLAACGGGGGGGGAPAPGADPAPAPIVSISVSPLSVTTGQSANITWSATNAAACTSSGAWNQAIGVSGVQATTQTVAGSYTYMITCTGPGGSGNAQATLSVVAQPPPAAPTISISLNPASITSGQAATLTWSTTNATACTANGAWSGAQATAGSLSVSPSAIGSYLYGINCSGPGGSAGSSATLSVTAVPNTVSIFIDGGLKGGTLNVPYVSVTVCEPGSSNCQTIDHVIVDTGSFGLRLVSPGVLNAGLKLPAVLHASGNELGECGVFADGFTWGTVRRADVKLAGEVAAAISIQTMGDQPGGATTIPVDCSNTGANESTAAKLGANGILGVGMFVNDCDACIARVIPATYYACSTSGCTGTTITAGQAVTNPVAHFPQDNNGVLLILPAVANSGATSPTGSLIFGIGTQANNALGSATIYAVDSRGNFTTTYQGQTISRSFSDSGSNAFFFADASITQCSLSTGFYCPTTPLALSANIKAISGSPSTTINFSIVDVDSLKAGVTAAPAGGPSGKIFGSSTFDWGLPFFFGRKVFTAISGTNTPGGVGPFLAF
ncbi:MAG: DUF3443 domain-containing protein [Betaproteobacteria bacterium]|nr:DUF3443 domain-containing protein [Betaproteobacteria bacterium]